MHSSRKLRSGAAVAALATTALLISACSGPATGGTGSDDAGPIVLGIHSTSSGSLAALGPDFEYGVRAGVSLATDGTNEIDGREIQFVVLDDGSDAGAVPAQARGLLQQDQPDLVFGPMSSASAVSAAPIFADAQVPAIFSISATSDLTGFSPYTFRTSRDALQEAQMGAAVADIQAGESFLVLAPDYAYGQSAAAAWQENLTAAGGESVSEPIFAPLDSRDYTAVAERIRNASPDVLVVVTFAGSGGPTLWQNLGDAGIPDSSEVVTLLPQRDTIEAMGGVAPKLKYFAIYSASVPGDLNAQFVETFTELSGGIEPDVYAGDSGVAGMIAVQAIREAGTTDSESVTAALSNLTGESIKGEFEVRAEDHTFLQSFYEATVGADGAVTIVDTFTLEDSATPVISPIEQ
ncbi:ABC transporter substrate-binding protein [Agrococcus sp. ARC_14]|uniref:ABC transporter substrate-binding protein n=1 Tax=Agrococcus sp. ARC_14 TaxID=2919927 RepID=UPI001F051EF6|nr:ABC transporter substrate-binding protein [Agrococcus sp. ARC_14]MCH1881396.1 ABC transporter substrate-binding protein [Agrococcus sp. ARC_14]